MESIILKLSDYVFDEFDERDEYENKGLDNHEEEEEPVVVSVKKSIRPSVTVEQPEKANKNRAVGGTDKGDKYEITSIAQEIKICGQTFVGYRIRALRDFGDVKKGDLGGCIQRPSNLSQHGNCWIGPGSIAAGASVVKENAIISPGVVIFDRAVISGNARISGPNASVGGKCEVSQNALVVSSRLSDYAKVYGNTIVEYSVLYGKHTVVCERAIVHGAEVEDRVIRGDAIYNSDMMTNGDYTYRPEPDEICW